MRRVKKTTNEQFDLLKSEMSVHLAAARGYGMGADRATVDAEWREIIEKLNALGPPHRSMTEWKKVWSDYRLRHLKILSRDFLPTKSKNHKSTTKKNKVSSKHSNSISYNAEGEEKPCLTLLNMQSESHHNTDESYIQDPFKDDERNSTKEQFFNSSIHSLDEQEEFYDNNDSNNYKSYCQSPPYDAIEHSNSDVKLNYLGQTLGVIEQQIKNQNIMMEHLSKITANLAELVGRHVTNLEKQNQIMERQLRATERQNMFLRRQEARRRKVLSKCKNIELQKSQLSWS